MNPLRKTFSLMTVGILTAALTTAPVNADAAGRGSAEERNRRAGIPACNAAGTAHIGGEEAVARVFGKPVPKDPTSLIDVCNDSGVLRIVPQEPVRSDLEDLDRRVFKFSRYIFCKHGQLLWNGAGLALLTETTPENEAADRKEAALYAKTIEASPKFKYLVNHVNTTYGQGTASGNIVFLLWVGAGNTLDNDRPSHRICGASAELWNTTGPRNKIAAAVRKVVEDYLGGVAAFGPITEEERKQLSRQLAKIPALDPSSP